MVSAPPLPRTKNPFDARLRAVHKAHQQEAFERVKRMTAEISALGRYYRERVTSVIASPRNVAEDAQRLRNAIAGMVPKLIDTLDGQFRDLAEWAWDAEVDGLIFAIPNEYWGKLTGMNLPESLTVDLMPGLDRLAERKGDDKRKKKGRPRGVGLGPFRGQSDAEPIARGLVPKREVDQAIRDVLFPAPSRDRVSEILRSGYNGQGWVDHLKGLSGKIADFNQLADQVALGMSRGENVQQLAKRITPQVGGIATSAQRVARTEGLRVSQEMQRASWSQIDDITVGSQVIATLDQFTRPEHAARHGTIYYKNPQPGQKSIDEAPQTPDQPNCRCYLTPVLAPPVDIQQNPELAAQWESPEGTIPDPATYDQWFAAQDEETQRQAVGGRRYDAIASRLQDDRAPEWSDFIDPDGKLLAASRLKDEDAFRRAERKAAVTAEINRRGEWFRQVAAKGFVTPTGAR